MKQACQYALIQFRPFAETGEFANIGVIVAAPKKGFFDFKLAPTRFARVTQFFKELDAKVYSAAISHFDEELNIVKKHFEGRPALLHKELPALLNRYTESLIRFSPLRIIGTDDLNGLTDILFNRYVGRDFIDKQYRETAMERALKQELKTKSVRVKFKKKTIPAGFRNITFPFAGEWKGQMRIIKPLAFEHKNSTKLFEHGEQWGNRLQWLINKDLLLPQNALIPIEEPKTEDASLVEAFIEAKRVLEKTDVQLVDYNHDSRKIIDFANGA